MDANKRDRRVLFLSASLSREAGGIFEIELALAKHLENQSFEVEAKGLEDEGWSKDRDRWAGIDAKVFPVTGPKFFGYSPLLAQDLKESDAPLLHLHTLWQYPSCLANQWVNGSQKPYLVTPNGMLEPWAIRNSNWKKRIALFAYEKKMLEGAACLHANTSKEADDFRSFGLNNPIAIIPNGVTLPREPKTEPLKPELKTLLFLGRIHPKKGLANALRAWRRCQEVGARGKEEWQFVVAGWDQGGHENELKEQCREAGVSVGSVTLEDFFSKGPKAASSKERPSVVFVGEAFGNHKDELLRRADSFILPSFSEGLPMAILEAWSYGLPVLMTDHCNLPEGFAYQAAIRIGTESDSIAQGLRELMKMSAGQRSEMGQRGRQLVEAKFTWPQVAAQMMEVYEWVLGRREKPGCVVECRARSESGKA
ncbi:MAG: glycosyltransferase [Akkermansiaceae bacterium]